MHACWDSVGLLGAQFVGFARFNQKFSLAKFCVEQNIDGGREMIQDMMEDEKKQTAIKKNSTTDIIDVNSDSSSDEDED